MESESERSDKTRVDGSVVLSTALSLSSTTTTEEGRGRHFFASLLPLSLLPYLSHPASPTLRRLPHAASPWRERRGTESRRTSRENENGSEKKTPLVAFPGDRFEKK